LTQATRRTGKLSSLSRLSNPSFFATMPGDAFLLDIRRKLL
jgi:hypothetical protein